MSSYIGKVQVGSGDQILIGSTLSGICSTAANTPAKVVTLPDFDTLMKGVTVHVRFTSGNSVTSGVTLTVGTTTAYPVIGNCVCNIGDTIPFTYYEDSTEHTWYANTNIVVAEGTTNGTVKVNGQDATVHGLGTAAYTPTTNYATAAQGTLADNAMPKSGGTFTGAITLSGAPSSDLQAATKKYVDDKTAGLSGLTGAMHYKGTSSTEITDGGTQNPTVDDEEITTKEAGDVVLYNNKEFVWNGSAWELLGDEGSYALKSSNVTVNFTQNTLPSLTLGGNAIAANQKLVTSVTVADSNTDAASLTTNDYTIPNVTNAGTAMVASVSQGVLTLTPGTNTQLGTAFSVKSVNQLTAQKMPTITVADSVVAWNAGSQASININGTKVVTTT